MNKHPVVKHFKFGSLIVFNPTKTPEIEVNDSSEDNTENNN